jgi:hypothetical protein
MKVRLTAWDRKRNQITRITTPPIATCWGLKGIKKEEEPWRGQQVHL